MKSSAISIQCRCDIEAEKRNFITIGISKVARVITSGHLNAFIQATIAMYILSHPENGKLLRISLQFCYLSCRLMPILADIAIFINKNLREDLWQTFNGLQDDQNNIPGEAEVKLL